MAAKDAVLDFTNVKDGGGIFNKKHYAPGDYLGKVTKVEDAPSKKDGVAQWLFTIQVKTGTYPYYCKHQENQYWKIRNLITAAGLNVPKKKVRVDPNRLIGKNIGVTLEDEEYEGRMQSVVSATFPPSELEDAGDEDTDDEVEDVEEEEEEEAPAPKAKKDKTKAKKTKAKTADEVADEELEELEIEDL